MTYYLTAMFIAAALLFAVHAPCAFAQWTIRPADPDKDTEQGNGLVVLDGKLSVYGTFTFRENTITYKNGVRNRLTAPARMKVNGKNWPIAKPFKLEFMPDLSKAVILMQQCGGKVEMKWNGEELELKLDQRKATDDGTFHIVLAMFNQEEGVKPAPPEEPETGKKTLPSKMDLIRIEKPEPIPSYWLFLSIRPRSSFYPTKLLIYRKMKIPLHFGRIDGSVMENDGLNYDIDLPWVGQPYSPENDRERAQRELRRALFGY